VREVVVLRSNLWQEQDLPGKPSMRRRTQRHSITPAVALLVKAREKVKHVGIAVVLNRKVSS